MSGVQKEYVFKISGYTPQTIPMERLAEYLIGLARLLGEPASVHFDKLVEGSTGIVHRIDSEAEPKVRARVESVRAGIAPPEVLRAQRDLDEKLASDNAYGEWAELSGAQILYFPGVRAEKTPEFGAVIQQTILDGIIRKVGGRGERTVSVMLQTHEGFETHCRATRDMARRLSKHYDLKPLRLTGQGKWLRTPNGWHLDNFEISSYEELDTRGLPEMVADIRSANFADLKSLKNPWATLREIRGDDGV